MATFSPAAPEDLVRQGSPGGGENQSRLSDLAFFSGRAVEESRETAQSEDSDFSIAQFLESERNKDMLRLSTAGSVDDGKSTLIGRLLYDSHNVYEDHVRAVTKRHGGAGTASIDFAQLTDGLRAEREQGITIDVAYRYFSTERRKFIIADTPGHEQYTRNMATGASTADLAVILIDATKGIVTQSRRHVYITSLLGIRHLVAAINKMDLAGFSAEVFARIEQQFRELAGQLGTADVKAIPISALDGDNVVQRSSRTPWYHGPTLLEHLETVPAGHEWNGVGFRFPVQRVIRPQRNYHQPNFRGFAGQIAAGAVRAGDRVTALPSGRSTRVASICTFDGDLEQARAPQSITLTLEDEFDISRGDIIVAAGDHPQAASAFEASLVWLDGRSFDPDRSYLLKHAAQTMNARVTAIRHRVNIHTLEPQSAANLAMNDIGVVAIGMARPIFFDSYQENRNTGSFILIDPETNATAAAGMIRGVSAASGEPTPKLVPGAVLRVVGPALVLKLEAALLEAGYLVVRTRLQDAKLLHALEGLGVIVLLEDPSENAEERIWLAGPSVTAELTPEAFFIVDPAIGWAEAAAHAIRVLKDKGILPRQGRGGESW